MCCIWLLVLCSSMQEKRRMGFARQLNPQQKSTSSVMWWWLGSFDVFLQIWQVWTSPTRGIFTSTRDEDAEASVACCDSCLTRCGGLLEAFGALFDLAFAFGAARADDRTTAETSDAAAVVLLPRVLGALLVPDLFASMASRPREKSSSRPSCGLRANVLQLRDYTFCTMTLYQILFYYLIVLLY